MSVACFNDKNEMVGVVILYIGKQKGSNNARGESVVRIDNDLFKHST